MNATDEAQRGFDSGPIGVPEGTNGPNTSSGRRRTIDSR